MTVTKIGILVTKPTKDTFIILLLHPKSHMLLTMDYSGIFMVIDRGKSDKVLTNNGFRCSMAFGILRGTQHSPVFFFGRFAVYIC